MSAAKSTSFDLKRSLIDAILAGLISLIVFGPIVGVVLDGYSFNMEPTRVAWLVAGVMVGRFVLSLFLQTPRARRSCKVSRAAAPACTCWRRTTNRGCAGSFRA